MTTTPLRFTDTVRELFRARRILVALSISVPLLIAQVRWSYDARALPLGALWVTLSYVLAPHAWRAWVGRGGLRGVATFLLTALLFTVTIGWVVPRLLDMGLTLMTARASLLIGCGAFCAGGWALGRDMDHEQRASDEATRAESLTRAAEDARLLAMRAHLDPHFLFNTLNAIAETCREDAEAAERAILALSDVLRNVMSGIGQSSWPLRREVLLCGEVIALHLVRYPDRFSFESTCDDDELLDTPVPPLLLLPLIENAMKHGPERGHRGNVALHVARSRVSDDELEIALTNPGPFAGRREGGHGLRIVEQRLALHFRGGGALTMERPTPDVTRAIVTLKRPPSDANTMSQLAERP